MTGNARVEHRDHHARAAGAVPGFVRADACVAVLVAPLLGIARVVRRERDLEQTVDFDEFDVGVRGDLAHQLFGFCAIQLAIGAHEFTADRQAAQLLQADGLATHAQRSGGIQRALHVGGVGARRAAVAVLDDETVVRRRRCEAAQVHAIGGEGRRAGAREDHRGRGGQSMQAHAVGAQVA